MDRRVHFRKGLSPLYLPYYDGLCKELGPEWQPYQGERSIEGQDDLYEVGRTPDTHHLATVTDAKGGESSHNYGCGSDWTIFLRGVPIWLPAEDPRFKPYLQACEKLGLKHGSTFKRRVDWYHNELALKKTWHEVNQVRQEKGLPAAMEFIRRNLVT